MLSNATLIDATLLSGKAVDMVFEYDGKEFPMSALNDVISNVSSLSSSVLSIENDVLST